MSLENVATIPGLRPIGDMETKNAKAVRMETTKPNAVAKRRSLEILIS
jgi:hypothetical protein